MLAVTKTAGLSGIRGMEVTVEVSAERGLPAYHVIGLGDTAVKESAERVRGAIMNSGFDYPKGRITVNLSPAWVLSLIHICTWSLNRFVRPRH